MQKLGDNRALKDKFFECFHTGLSEFYDPIPSLWARCVIIDITKFDKWLHKTVGDYEEDGMSLSQAVSEYFGDDAALLIDELTLDFIRERTEQ